MSDLIEQIRRAHKSARPKPSNPAWCNTHRNLGATLDALEHEREEVYRRDCDLEGANERIEALEDRLELHPVSGTGKKRTDIKLNIGDCDGIGCRDETIRLQDQRIEKLEITAAHHREIAMDYVLDCDAALRERNTSLEATLKSIQKRSGDWYQGATDDGAAFTMKRIWDECNEVLDQTTSEVLVSTDVGSSDGTDKST